MAGVCVRQGRVQARSLLEGVQGVEQLQQVLLAPLLASHPQISSHLHQGSAQAPSQHLHAGMRLLHSWADGRPESWVYTVAIYVDVYSQMSGDVCRNLRALVGCRVLRGTCTQACLRECFAESWGHYTKLPLARMFWIVECLLYMRFKLERMPFCTLQRLSGVWCQQHQTATACKLIELGPMALHGPCPIGVSAL